MSRLAMKSKRASAIGFLVVLILSLFIWRVYVVNNGMESYEVKRFGAHEWVDISQSFFDKVDEVYDETGSPQSQSYFVRIDACKKLSEKDFYASYAPKLTPQNVHDTPNSIIEVDLSLKNDDPASNAYYDLFEMMLISRESAAAFVYNEDLQDTFYKKTREDKDDGFTVLVIKPNSEAHYKVFYTANGITKNAFTYNHEGDDFYLVGGLAPTRLEIQLPLGKFDKEASR